MSEEHIPHPSADQLDLVVVLAALADRWRLGALRALAGLDDDAYCGQIQVQVDFNISKSTMSHHMKTLRDAGLTRTRVVGAKRYVSLRRDAVESRFPGLLDAVLSTDLELAPLVQR
jgi:DNA-binding transcriptional ArsR family regulator